MTKTAAKRSARRPAVPKAGQPPRRAASAASVGARLAPRGAAAENPSGRAAERAVAAQAEARAEAVPSTTTIRLRPEVRRGLEFLHGKLGGTMNKLVNDGLAAYVQMRTAALDDELRSALDEIRKLRQSDPMFTKDFADVARAEAMHTSDDPAQGVAARRSSRKTKTGSAVSMVRSLIASTR